MSTDRKPDSVGSRTNAQNEINDLPTPESAADNVRGGAGPIDSKTGIPSFGPIDGKTPPRAGPIDA